jgi:hypothetical protein
MKNKVSGKYTSLFHYWSRKFVNNEENEEMKCVLPTIQLLLLRLVILITQSKTKPAAESICKDSAASYQRLSLLWVDLYERSQ